MRTSIILSALIITPALLVACTTTTDPTEPITGTVVEKEYEPATTCPKKTGKKTKKPCTPKPACHELDIRLDRTDQVIEICDEAAYNALDTDRNNRYSSAIDYTREEH